MSYVQLSGGYSRWVTPLACGPVSPVSKKSNSDMAGKLCTLTFTCTHTCTHVHTLHVQTLHNYLHLHLHLHLHQHSDPAYKPHAPGMHSIGISRSSY